MRRRTLRSVSKIVLVVWTIGAMIAGARLCLSSPASHYGPHTPAAHAVAAAAKQTAPVDPDDDDCPPVPDSAVDSGPGDCSLELLAAFTSAPVLVVQPALEMLALRVERFSRAAPTLIPAYLVAHRLRF